MGARTFNDGDVVKIGNTSRQAKYVQPLAGKYGVVVGRKSSGMVVSYMVEVDGKVYQIKHARTLKGPYPKEVLINPDYKTPVTQRPEKYWYDKNSRVIEIKGETQEVITTIKGSIIRADKFNRNYKPISKEDEKYIVTLPGGDKSAYRLMLKSLLTNPKRDKIFKKLNIPFKAIVINEQIIKSLLTYTDVTAGGFEYRIMLYAYKSPTIRVHKDTRIVAEVDIYKWKTTVEAIGLLYFNDEYAELVVENVNNLIEPNWTNVPKLRDMLLERGNWTPVYTLGGFEVFIGEQRNYISITLRSGTKTIVYTAVYVDGKADTKIHHQDELDKFLSIKDTAGDLGGLFNL